MNAITGVILAGGQGSRLGGVDKGWLSVAGQPAVVQVLAALQPQVQGVIIVANRNLERYQSLNAMVISDAEPIQFLGPLAGIMAAMAICPTPYMLTLPVDALAPPPDLAQQLWFVLGAKPAALLCTAHGRQPLCALWSCALLPNLKAMWQAGSRSPNAVLQAVNAAEYFCDWPEQGLSLNNRDEFFSAELAIANGHVSPGLSN